MKLEKWIDYSWYHKDRIERLETLGSDPSVLYNPDLSERDTLNIFKLQILNIDTKNIPINVIDDYLYLLISNGNLKYDYKLYEQDLMSGCIERLDTKFDKEQLEKCSPLELYQLHYGMDLEVDETEVNVNDYFRDIKPTDPYYSLIVASIKYPDLIPIGLHKLDTLGKYGTQLVHNINTRLYDKFYTLGYDMRDYSRYIFEEARAMKNNEVYREINRMENELDNTGRIDISIDDRFDNVQKTALIQTYIDTGIDLRLLVTEENPELQGFTKYKFTKDEMIEYRKLSNQWRGMSELGQTYER